MLGPTTSMQIDLPCIQIQALKFKILNLSFLAVYSKYPIYGMIFLVSKYPAKASFFIYSLREAAKKSKG